jgi:hypothetical protein
MLRNELVSDRARIDDYKHSKLVYYWLSIAQQIGIKLHKMSLIQLILSRLTEAAIDFST